MRHLRRRNGPLTKNSFLTMSSAAALIAASVTIASPAFADDATAQKWIDSEFQPSTLSKADQLKELQWFEKAAQPFKGMEINVVSETSTTSFRKATWLKSCRPRCSPARTCMTAGSTTPI